jgi:glucokinase
MTPSERISIAAATTASALLLFGMYRLFESKDTKAKRQIRRTMSNLNKTTFLLAGDIGGTNSRFALHLPGRKDPLLVHIYPNEEALKESKSYHHATLKPFFEKCLQEVEDWMGCSEDEMKAQVQVVACLAVAGPVKSDNSVFMTNIAKGCKIDGNEIEQCTDGLLDLVVRCKLVNDFVGQGYGLLDLDLNKEVVELLPGSKERIDPLGPKACVGAGTGLGECFLTINSLAPELGYECYPCEGKCLCLYSYRYFTVVNSFVVCVGGHVDWVSRGPLEAELHEYLKNKFGAKTRVSTERVVSGRGLANVYEFLAKRFPDRVDKAVHEEFLNAGDQQGRVVGVNSKKEGSLARQATEIMLTSYGAEVGNAALKYIPTGGLYLSGGLTPKNIQYIEGMDSPFMKAYLDKGRMTSLCESIPLFAVKNEDIGLRGARVCAERVSAFLVCPVCTALFSFPDFTFRVAIRNSMPLKMTNSSLASSK